MKSTEGFCGFVLKQTLIHCDWIQYQLFYQYINEDKDIYYVLKMKIYEREYNNFI